ncbi:hypothetical protein, partial [Vibrio parahaemolyticus]|uniref:hypothetical protein n=1 Tax=Vibrio parahaemolyticus TaxID=670 RepID=UPI0023623C0D
MRLSPNKAFKSDSQRSAFSLRSSIAERSSHLNAALCVNGGNMENQGKLFFFCGKMGAGKSTKSKIVAAE